MWKLWIDTGGTFTDCVALAPDGTLHRIKILSQGGLRGRIIRKINPHVYEFEAPWQYESPLLEGYVFKIQKGREETRLLGIDYKSKTLTIERNLPSLTGHDFEIFSGEETPVMAARLATKTSLTSQFPSMEMRLGTTKGTNALLERKGAKTLLLVTKGFKDLLRIGTQQRPDLFQLNIPDPTLLYHTVIEIDERVGASGQIIRELDLAALSTRIAAGEFESVAISLLNGCHNTVHEETLTAWLQACGFRFISPSTRLFASIHYLRRSQTAIVNAYLAPILDQYINNIKTGLGGGDVHVMTSAGGLVRSENFLAKDSLLSGPAGGTIAAADLAAKMGIQKVITFDMGGTSTDVARIDVNPELKYTTFIDGIEFHNPSLAIETVAAGGGSICWFDGFSLQVGPESAGAQPGPASYGSGGPLTITDVNILLGKMDTSKFGIPIHHQAAQEALDHLLNEIFEKTGNSLSGEQVLSGLEHIANEKMAEAIHRISVSKGINPQHYALLAFGGAGGLHGCQLAEIMGIDTVILPYDAGLFSASGMGTARAERILMAQILQPWDQVSATLPERIEALLQEAHEALAKERIQTTEIKFCSVFLRFTGQENALEIAYSDSNTLAKFRETYTRQFGYYPENRTIELESLRLMVSEKRNNLDVSAPMRNGIAIPPHHTIQTAFHSGAQSSIATYAWDELKASDEITGPAILMNASSTSFIPASWKVVIQHNLDAIALVNPIHKDTKIHSYSQEAELELFTNRFKGIAEEMGAQLQRTAFSINIKERLDFSCALIDPEGELLVNAPHIPVHLGSLGICTRLVREKIAIGPGDVVITNHPKYGGSHLPDVTLIMGAFTHDNTLIGYLVNRAHHAEIGGKTPGSMPADATRLSEEGVVIIPQYLVKNGVLQWDAIKVLFSEGEYPSRSYAENEADLIASLSALRKGHEQLVALVAQHGLRQVHKYMSLLKEKAFSLLQDALIPYGDRRLKATEFLDDGHRIQVLIEFSGGTLTFDFAGTSRTHPKNLNANISILYSSILYVLRLLINKDIPLNEGMMRNVRIILPDDSFLNPHFDDNPDNCPAVVGGNTEVSQRLVDTLLKGFGIAACSQGTMNNFLFGDEDFGYYETIGGGTGAGPGFHGRSGVHQHMTNTRITDPEDLERRYPVRLLEFGLREGSGGSGTFRGGDGTIRTFEFLKSLDITVISQHRNFSPYGIAGGHHGQSGMNLLQHPSGKKSILSGAFNTQVQAGDQLTIKTPGGGGFGESAI